MLIGAAALGIAVGVVVDERRSPPAPAGSASARAERRVSEAAPSVHSAERTPTDPLELPAEEPDGGPLTPPPEVPAESANADRVPRAAAPAPALSEDPAALVSPREAPLDPVARAALSMVGADPEADEYWLAAINDPSLPAEERQDLIEDLNEDGLSDPQHPTADDLPLILNRLQLIEAVKDDAMDEVNADAFLEAYNDLLNLARVASGGPLP